MENPRSINRFLIAVLIAFTAVNIVASVYFRILSILFVWLAALVAFFLICRGCSLLNIVVFGPLFRLLGWLDARFTNRRSRGEQGQ